jgi:hypothetical protein
MVADGNDACGARGSRQFVTPVVALSRATAGWRIRRQSFNGDDDDDDDEKPFAAQ